MSKRRILSLFYKDITLFFKGRRKIRRKAEVLYFISLFVVAFLMAVLYRRLKVFTVIFSISFTFFLYLLMSFIFELKHFIFFEEDMKITGRLPVSKREYFLSKGMLIGFFGILFTVVASLGNFLGALVFAGRVIPLQSVFLSLLFNTYFSMAFAMFIYAVLLKIFKGTNASDIVAKLQIALGVIFGLVFAFSPKLAPLLDIIDRQFQTTSNWFLFLPFAWFVKAGVRFNMIAIILSVFYIGIPLFLGVIIGFEEVESRQYEDIKKINIPFIKDRGKRAIYLLVLTHILRSKITKKTLIAPTVINTVVLFLWSFTQDAANVLFFGVWTLIFMSVITSLTLFITDSYKAAWMLLKSPFKNGNIVSVAIDAVFTFIVIPYALIVVLVFVIKGVYISQIIISVFYGLSASYMFLQLLFIIKPTMIFSRAGFERGINSVKELIVSFVFVPLVATMFNVVFRFKGFCILKASTLVFLFVGYLLNMFISRRSFILKY